jgi:hypothetical protein
MVQIAEDASSLQRKRQTRMENDSVGPSFVAKKALKVINKATW